MPQVELPFSNEVKADKNSRSLFERRFYQMMSEQLQQAIKKNHFLLDYLYMVPIDRMGIPEYYPKLTPKQGSIKQPNLIYPVSDSLFTHICPDLTGEWTYYIPIEPILTRNLDPLMLEVEKRLLDFSDKFDVAANDEKKRGVLLKCVDEMCGANGDSHKKGKWPFGRNGNGKLKITQNELWGIKYLLVRDKVGLGIIEPMIRDKYIEDISCSGLGNIYIEHKIFQSLKSAVVFSNFKELDKFVLSISERVKRPVSLHSPIADSTLPDGSRINIVYGSHLSRRGSNFSIRKFSEVPFSILELIEFGTLDYKMAAYLSLIIGYGMNLFMSGETASGKTTTLNSLTTFIRPNAKIVSIEETPELQVPHNNWIREVVEAKKESTDSGVTMFDLLKAALRQRPNFILIGEIRGREGSIAFQAMQTGHAVMSTFHAATVEKLIQRLTGDPIYVPKTYIDNLNAVVIQASVKLPNSTRFVRRVISISEIVGFDSQSQTFSFIEVFRWDPITDSFKFTGDMASYLLEEIISVKLGFPPTQKRRVYAELVRRAEILEKIHKERGVRGFYELLQVLAKAQQEGLF